MKKLLYISIIGLLLLTGFFVKAQMYTTELSNAFDRAHTQGLTNTGDIDQAHIYSGIAQNEAIDILNKFASILNKTGFTVTTSTTNASNGFFLAHLVDVMRPGDYTGDTARYNKALEQGVISTINTTGLQAQQIRGYAFLMLHNVYNNISKISNIHITPATQTAISGSTVTFTVTGQNGTGIMYMKYILPQTENYDIMFSSATREPTNHNFLSIQHNPIFVIPANENFSITITAKVVTYNRSFPTLTTTGIFSDNENMSTTLTSAVAQIEPITDLKITNILTGGNPSVSGDTVQYYVTLQNIGSTNATGINFISTFPLPILSIPTANFNGTPYVYSNISYPNDLIWSGIYLNNLNPGETMTILLNGLLTENIAVGTPFNHTVKVTTVNPEYTTGNNSALATGSVQTHSDVRVTKTLAPFTGYRAGDEVRYTITYGNSGGKLAENVQITDTMDGQVTLNATSFPIRSLPSGSGGTIILTGKLNVALSSGRTFVNTANITTTTPEATGSNNTAIATGTIPGIHGLYVRVSANNITRPQLNNAPYGSGPNTMIQAASGDTVQVTITYGNSGNTVGTHARLQITGLNNFVAFTPILMGTIPNVIDIDEVITLVHTATVGPRNFISFDVTPRIIHDIGEVEIGNTVTIVEPMVCGDGLLTRNEPCDTEGSLGVHEGQSCENQQGRCVLVTNAIINLACINYSFVNPIGGPIIQEQKCSSVYVPITRASCTSMTGSTPIATNSGYTVNYTCKGNATTNSTPITINCGNGTSITGTGSQLNGTCSYASSFVGNAQCSVGSDVNNPICRLAVNETHIQCDLEALDGKIILVDDNGKGEGRFRCETRDGVIAQTIRIDCGIGSGNVSANNTSQIETVCKYDKNTIPNNKVVRCYTNDVVCELENIILDKPTLGLCGNGIVEGYEQCDDGMSLLTGNGTPASNCTLGCSIKDNENLVSCFNVGNTNISIQKGEQLPFRWTLDGSKNIIPGSSCAGNSNGKIPEESIWCTFNVYNGDQKESNHIPVHTYTGKCNTNSWSNYKLLNYFMEQQNNFRSLKNAFGKYSIDSNEFKGSTFGEYKIVLEKVTYDYCTGNNVVLHTSMDRVCSVDFALTQPYLAQKSLFAMTPKSTDIRLGGYKTIDGQDLIKSTDLDEIMILDESNYNGGTQVKTMINNFITKYDNLALTVPKSSLTGTVFKDIDVTVKVVPSQKIYILESDTQRTVQLDNIKSFTTPFTIVTKNIDLVIKGNVEYNGMFLVQNGTISFEQAAGNTIDRCPSPQTVKGIFITDEGFVASPSLKNNDLNQLRCSHGNLHVKGILIGDRIEDLVQSRRSHLNTWFSVKSSAETAIKSERRNKIFDGAAVLIEYSPSLWNALPPGASEFTKVLNVYKK